MHMTFLHPNYRVESSKIIIICLIKIVYLSCLGLSTFQPMIDWNTCSWYEDFKNSLCCKAAKFRSKHFLILSLCDKLISVDYLCQAQELKLHLLPEYIFLTSGKTWSRSGDSQLYLTRCHIVPNVSQFYFFVFIYFFIFFIFYFLFIFIFFVFERFCGETIWGSLI